MKKNIALFFALSFLLAACSVFPAAQPTPTAAPTPSPVTPTPHDAPILPPKGALEAQKALADLLGVPLDSVKITSFKTAEWPDGCLGLATPAMTCMAVITPGYQVILEHNGRNFEYRTDLEGGVVLSAGVIITRMEEYAPVVQAAAKHLNANAADVLIERILPMQWESPCLGYINPAELCAQRVTPGFNLMLQISGQLYEVHTDLALTRARLPGGIDLLAQ